MGSMSTPQAELPPQQPFAWPEATRSAAWPYFSFTTSLMFVVLIVLLYLQQRMVCGAMALFRVQHSAYRKLSRSCRASVLAEYHRNVPSRRTRTRSSFFSFSR